MNPRKHGLAPFRVAVIHGGPGAGGEMAPVARRLAERFGVLEPIQTELSVQGQVAELHDVLLGEADLPVTLVGYSWGAWLSILVGSEHPEVAGKIILVSSGAFSEEYVAELTKRRMDRLSEPEKADLQETLARLDNPDVPEKDELLSRLGRIASKADAYAPVAEPEEPAASPLNGDIYQRVWIEAAAMRRTGELLRRVRSLTCPVVAIHGDADPSPAAGVCEPLSANLRDYRFVLLAKCGHTPWRERYAQEHFYEVLLSELA